jgi:hypothetical protein
MELSAGLDWISVTFPHGFSQRWRTCVHPADTEKQRETRPRNGYTRATVHPSGATQATNDNRRDMGIHVVYSASAIAQMFDLYGVDQKQLLEHLCNGAKIARMDVKLDCLDSGLNIENLYKMAKNGNVETLARSIGYQESASTGNEAGAPTCYVGSLKYRKKLLRVYDKGAQNGELIDLKRFELELHRDGAKDAVKLLKTANLRDWAQHIAGLIKGYCYWPHDNIVEQIFSDFDKIKIAVPAFETGNTVNWLLEVCAPVLAREAVMDSGLLVEFMHRVTEKLEALDAIEEQGAGK